MQNSKLLFLGALVVIGVSGFAFYKLYFLPHNLMTYNNDSKTAYQKFVSADYANAVSETKALLANAPNKSEMGRLEIILAASYWFRNLNDDRAQSVKILKGVINDYTIPSVWRAQALNNIARFVFSSDITFYQINLNEAPYDAFLPKTGSEGERIRTAYINILKYSDDTYPTSWAEYAIANYYTSSIANNDQGVSTTDAVAKSVYGYVLEGDTRNDQKIYSPSVLLLGYFYRALALNASGRVLNKVSVDERELNFKKVLDIATALDQNSTDSKNPSLPVLLNTRFFYAAFISMNFSKRESDIETILEPFSQIDVTKTDISFFRNINNLATGDAIRVRARALSKNSPAFKGFLNKISVTP